jgi:hypothetical protein
MSDGGAVTTRVELVRKSVEGQWVGAEVGNVENSFGER